MSKIEHFENQQDGSIDPLLETLGARFGDDFRLTAEQIDDFQQRQAERHKIRAEEDACICDVPKDVCTAGCDAGDWTCNNQHDIVCIKCDEGDVCLKEDGSCNLAGDISCGKKDK